CRNFVYAMYFFFQAEDGIRDKLVTGVQTCALPISLREVLNDASSRQRQLDAFAKIEAIMSTGNQSPSVRAADIVLAMMRKSRRRSEERRVGKECRARGAEGGETKILDGR